MKNDQPLLVGFVIDVSQSMKRNWKNKDGQLMPKIEVIRDDFNDFFASLKESLGGMGATDIKIFCLGIGFVLKENFAFNKTEDGREIRLKKGERTLLRNDIICDLIALSEMVPNRNMLKELENALDQMWQEYAHEILEEANANPEAPEQLRTYLQARLHESSRQTLLYRWYLDLENGRRNWPAKLVSFVFPKLKRWPEEIERVSTLEIERYFSQVIQQSKRLFQKKQQEYVQFVIDQLQQFLNEEINYILERNTLGFSFQTILQYFDKDKAKEIAGRIFKYLNKDVRKHFGVSEKLVSWTILLCRSLYLGSPINLKKVKYLSEACVKLEGNKLIKPFVREQIQHLFSDTFQKQTKNRITEWISLSRHREAIRSLPQVQSVLPQTKEDNVYSEEYMFGVTPFDKALDLAAMRILSPEYKTWRKALVLISDGEFDRKTAGKSISTADMLKSEYINVISGLIASETPLRKVKKVITRDPVDGHVIMMHLASNTENWLEIQTILRERGDVREKLLFQLNNKEDLENVLHLVFGGRS